MTQSLFGRSSGIVGDGKQRILYKEMDGNKRDTIIGKMLWLIFVTIIQIFHYVVYLQISVCHMALE